MTSSNNNSLRIGLLGSVDVGKSSLLGVLKSNKLDDGRGGSRKNILYHPHEIKSGRTSSVTPHYIDLDDSLITIVDLAGHEAYLKTTIYGLYGLNLDAVCILIGANMGVSKMTKEHFTLAKFLDIPIIFIINKIDICPENIINETVADLNKLVKHISENTKKINIIEDDEIIINNSIHKNFFVNNDVEDIYNIYLNNDNIDKIKDYNIICKNKNLNKNKVFSDDYFSSHYSLLFISNKTGYGIENLKKLFININKSNYFLTKKTIKTDKSKIVTDETNTFIIQNTYNVNGIGLVFFGYVRYGCVKKNDTLNIGPFNSKFYKIYVRNIRNINDKDIPVLHRNNFGCIAIKQLDKNFNLKKNHIRKGIYITNTPNCYSEFIAKVFIFHHPTSIKKNYQATIHSGTVIQAAQFSEIINIKPNKKKFVNDNNNNNDVKCLRSGDIAKVRFKFLFRPEYIENNSMFIFRENNSKGIGKIIRII
tara:strand:- start:64 stop:1497 length:1434 start_codon:yes stop_codon:yes gene_type:complete